jgi:hypothetical protein
MLQRFTSLFQPLVSSSSPKNAKEVEKLQKQKLLKQK